jgi:hypothetical protein
MRIEDPTHATSSLRATASSTASDGDYQGSEGTGMTKEISNILIPKTPLTGQKPCSYKLNIVGFTVLTYNQNVSSCVAERRARQISW